MLREGYDWSRAPGPGLLSPQQRGEENQTASVMFLLLWCLETSGRTLSGAGEGGCCKASSGGSVDLGCPGEAMTWDQSLFFCGHLHAFVAGG